MGVYRASDADDEYAKLIRRMNPPRVVIDNEACETATVIRVDSVNRHGILLEVVQILTDLGLVVTKAYISSDGGWFMDVFHVTDHEGNKVLDKDVMQFIEKSIEKEACILPPAPSCSSSSNGEYTSIELTGTDRPGLLSEVCAVLAGLECNVVRAELWTHNSRAAAVVHVTDARSGRGIVEADDPERMSCIREFLRNVLRGGGVGGGDEHHGRGGGGGAAAGRMRVSDGKVHTERRLHQLMYDDRDYARVAEEERGCSSSSSGSDGGSCGCGGGSSSSSEGDGGVSRQQRRLRPHVVLLDCFEKDYTIAILRSQDRPKLLFDTLCTLTDMQYVVYHGTVHTGGEEAYQEYYIRHVDGHPVISDAERERVIQCLEAAIERRSSEGTIELEVRTDDRVGLLSSITRVFRENGLRVRRAKISTEAGKAVDTFHVADLSGERTDDTSAAVVSIDADRIGYIQQQIGQEAELRVVRRWQQQREEEEKEKQEEPKKANAVEAATTGAGFLLGSFLRACSFQNFRLIRSYS